MLEAENLAKILDTVFEGHVWDDSVLETADRVLRYWSEYNPKEDYDFKFTKFKAPANNLVICKDIEFASLCAHHLLPFYGRAHVGYIPGLFAIGLSKLPRLVDHWASRPQLQERLTEEIASDLKHQIEAQGVMVVIEARHTCMACRGVRKHNGVMVTSSLKGAFLTNPYARDEFFNAIRNNGGI